MFVSLYTNITAANAASKPGYAVKKKKNRNILTDVADTLTKTLNILVALPNLITQ